MMHMMFSPKEAAILAEVSEKVLRHEMARDILDVQSRPVGKAVRRRLNMRDIFYLRLLSALPVGLSVDDRRDLHTMIAQRLTGKGRWQRRQDGFRLTDGVVVDIATGNLRRDLARRLRLYRRGLRRVESRRDLAGGEPVFSGTRIPVRHIGQLANRGVALTEILEDYPALTADDIAFACLLVALRPDPGRPRKRLTFNRAT